MVNHVGIFGKCNIKNISKICSFNNAMQLAFASGYSE